MDSGNSLADSTVTEARKLDYDAMMEQKFKERDEREVADRLKK
jgi:hypothetical protein